MDQILVSLENAKYLYEEKLRPVARPQATAAKSLSTYEYIKFINELCSRQDTVGLIIGILNEYVRLDKFVSGLKDILGAPNVRLLLTSRHEVDLKSIMELRTLLDFDDGKYERGYGDYLVTEVQGRIAYGRLEFKQKGLDTLIVAAIARLM